MTTPQPIFGGHGTWCCDEDGLPHRVSGPAIEWNDGGWSWWLYGDMHRYYGPQNLQNEWVVHGRIIK